jgi:hypothetical protein
VAHTYNTNNSAGIDQEDLGSKSAWANNLQDPILKKTLQQKRASRVSRYRPCVQTPVPQKKKKKEKKFRISDRKKQLKINMPSRAFAKL